ncbi:MAG: metal ABC transporter substrate-binding protein [Promethearchaeota archaeon]
MVANRRQTGIIAVLFILTVVSFNTSGSAGLNSISPGEITPGQTSLSVVTTTEVVLDIVGSIVGNESGITNIVSGHTDVHTFDGPTQSQLDTMLSADVIFALGIGSAEAWYWNEVVIENPSLWAKTVNLTDEAVDGRDDPLLDNTTNPHVWMDPNIAKKMANVTAAHLIANDASNAATFTANNATFQAELDALLANIASNATVFSGMKVVVNHPAFMYLFDLLGIDRLITIQEHEHGGEPGQSHLTEVIELMESENSTLIVTTPQQNADDAYEVARSVPGCKIADMSAIPGTYENYYTTYEVEDYISMVEYCLYSLNNPSDPPVMNIPWIPIIIASSIGVVVVVIGMIVVNRKKKRG